MTCSERMPDRREFMRYGALATALATAGVPRIAMAAVGDDTTKEKPPLAAMFFGGELKEVRAELEKRYRLKAFSGGMKQGSKAVEGLEHLADCDLWIGSVDKRSEPGDEQLEHFKKFHARGGAFAGYRAASHVFQNYLQADLDVFGAKYGGHHLLEHDPILVIEVVDDAADHEILKGLAPPRPASGSYSYTEVADDVTVLLKSGLAGDMMPHTWIRENAKTKGRVFYTRYDAKELATNETCREIFLRGVAWTLGGKKTAAKGS
ncbi:MAG: ThuA domain-containing protein [Pirellulales bacterium]